MKIDCEHWKECGVNGGGCCLLNKYGGKPSWGTCRVACKGEDAKTVIAEILPEHERNTTVIPVPAGPMDFDSVVRRAAVSLGARAASTEEIAKRSQACLTCSFLQGLRCAKCGCGTCYKVANAGEHCPAGKW